MLSVRLSVCTLLTNVYFEKKTADSIEVLLGWWVGYRSTVPCIMGVQISRGKGYILGEMGRRNVTYRKMRLRRVRRRGLFPNYFALHRSTTSKAEDVVYHTQQEAYSFRRSKHCVGLYFREDGIQPRQLHYSVCPTKQVATQPPLSQPLQFDLQNKG